MENSKDKDHPQQLLPVLGKKQTEVQCKSMQIQLILPF